MNDTNAWLSLVGGAVIIAGVIIANNKRSFWLYNAAGWVFMAIANVSNTPFFAICLVTIAVSLVRWTRHDSDKK